MEGRMERNQFLGDFINQIKPYLKPPPATEFFFFLSQQISFIVYASLIWGFCDLQPKVSQLPTDITVL